MDVWMKTAGNGVTIQKPKTVGMRFFFLIIKEYKKVFVKPIKNDKILCLVKFGKSIIENGNGRYGFFRPF